jgi:hypothetical protein
MKTTPLFENEDLLHLNAEASSMDLMDHLLMRARHADSVLMLLIETEDPDTAGAASAAQGAVLEMKAAASLLFARLLDKPTAKKVTPISRQTGESA